MTDVPELHELEAALREAGAGVLVPARSVPAAFAERPILRDRLPLPGGSMLAVLEAGDEVLVIPLAPMHARDEAPRRAVPGDGAAEGVRDVIRRGEPIGRFVPSAFAALPAARGERAIDVDQSNESTIVGEAVVVKMYPRTTPGPQPGLDLQAHLAVVGFRETPAPLGTLRWESSGAPPVLLATAAAYLPGARDGWEWFLERVLEAIDAGDSEPSLAAASATGGLVARLHGALATPSSVFPTPVADAGRHEIAAWNARAEATLDEALALTGGDEGERLRGLAPAARAAIARLAEVEATPTMRIHGDLHVGQVLAWAGGYAIADFDGDPLAPAPERNARGPIARDVASFVRSLDHLGRIAQRRDPARDDPSRDDRVEAWIEQARHRFLSAYRAGLGPSHAGLFDERLLVPLEVAQACHEYVYAARYLPRWLYVPDLALPRLLGRIGS